MAFAPAAQHPSSSCGYPGPPTSAKVVYFHRVAQIRKHDVSSCVRYTPQAWYLDQFGFMGYLETNGDPHCSVQTYTVCVYLCNALEELRRPIRCRVTLLDMSVNRCNDVVLIDETLSRVEDWGRGKVVSIKAKHVPFCVFHNGKDLVVKYEAEWC